MKHIDILHRSMNTPLLDLQRRKDQSDENDQYVNGLIAGVKLTMTLVEAWGIEAPNDYYDTEHEPYPVKIN